MLCTSMLQISTLISTISDNVKTTSSFLTSIFTTLLKFPADLVIFTKEIRSGKLQFCAVPISRKMMRRIFPKLQVSKIGLVQAGHDFRGYNIAISAILFDSGVQDNYCFIQTNFNSSFSKKH